MKPVSHRAEFLPTRYCSPKDSGPFSLQCSQCGAPPFLKTRGVGVGECPEESSRKEKNSKRKGRQEN